ncbi:MAG TPA: MarR family transcriptional regulator [Pseudonocardia sp.]|uniref:MarR family winged helix-turn-helix transcriptional regulator n=1 Tax=Pseudonocardia sp. TaxID=60912 RepID=UPI002B4AB083|nr:MarR family transcriptional regulator [Pseudonocardia sp.]HLU59584.1 MarR family transcriptional regulator [Pseudonocardia sp.]
MGHDERDAVDEIADQWARERPDVPTSAIGVVARVLRIAKAFADHRRRTLAALGIDSATFDLLATLRRTGAPFRLSPAELAQACLVTGGAISQRVARAEAAGFVQTRRTSGGHTTAVELTPAGRERIDRDIAEFLAAEERLVAHLSPGDRAELARLLRALGAGL